MKPSRVTFKTSGPVGHSFFVDGVVVAEGTYENCEYILLHRDELTSHENAMQAFCALRTEYNKLDA